MKNLDPVLILGARSGIARAMAAEYAKLGYPLMLAARDGSSLERDASDLMLRYQVTVTTHSCDITALAQHDNFLNTIRVVPSVAVCAVGLLGDQVSDAGDVAATQAVLDANLIGPVLMLEKLAARMAEAGGRRAIVGLGSVAGDRGRAKNYIYGSAKAGFAVYLSGLRQKYVNTRLQILTVKPGFVRTAMTEGMETPGALTSDADAFAARVVRAQRAGSLVYYDARWRLLMMIIRAVPESIFKSLKF